MQCTRPEVVWYVEAHTSPRATSSRCKVTKEHVG